MANEINGLNNGSAQGPTQAQQVRVARSEPNLAQQQTGRPASFDTVTLTETASQLRSLTLALAERPVVDTKRVDDLRRAIANGTYSIDAGKVADRLLDYEAAILERGQGERTPDKS